MEKNIDLSGFREGNERAWKGVFEAYWRPIVFFICRKNGDIEDAEDLAQQCFIKLYEIRSQIESLLHLNNTLYLLASQHVVNNIRQVERRRKRERDFSVGLDQTEYQTVEGALQEHRILLQAFAKLGELTPPEKAAMLYWLQAYTWQGIRRTGGQYAALCRAKKRLRKIIAPMI